jgi:uncharacterized phage-associated protein
VASVYDVAAFVEQRLGSLSAYKLQKLVYYAQAWSLAWDGRPLFPQVIKAWVDGPVSPELWHSRRNGSGSPGNPDALRPEEIETIEAVLRFYGRMSADRLIELSHREAPWRVARRGVAKDEPSVEAISHASMRRYYGPMAEGRVKQIPEAVQRGVSFLLSVPEDRLGDLVELDDVDGDDLLDWLESDGRDPWEEG